MNKMALLTILLLFAGPLELSAFRDHRPVGKILDTVPLKASSSRYAHRSHEGMQPTVGEPLRPGAPGRPAHPINPGNKPHSSGYHRPYFWWPATSTVVREVGPIIIVNTPPSGPPPPPEPQKVWVPPVMDTRIEAGYWDYGVRKVWMGDHWRYEQDFDQPAWVPEREVRFVKQEGYWKTVD